MLNHCVMVCISLHWNITGGGGGGAGLGMKDEVNAVS